MFAHMFGGQGDSQAVASAHANPVTPGGRQKGPRARRVAGVIRVSAPGAQARVPSACQASAPHKGLPFITPLIITVVRAATA